jgi:hypothetical protein
MKTTLLSVSLTLPILIIGVGQSFASTKVINQGDYQFTRPTTRTSQATLDSHTSPPFYLAARTTDKEPDCRLAGLCDDDRN